MPISRQIREAMERASWIRRMFEEGRRLSREVGPENVFDFSLGNPDLPPPDRFFEVLLEEAARRDPMIHCYMPNAGYDHVREELALVYRNLTSLDFTSSDIIMTNGASGALNVALKALLEPGDEVVTLAPFFVEYEFYIGNHGGKMVSVQTGDDFLPDLDALEAAIGPRTRAVIINSPNNPTGVLYPPETIKGLAEVLATASRRFGRSIILLSDEPYREIIFDGMRYPSPFLHYPNTIVATSNSKDLSLAGERIGHLAISPLCDGRGELSKACIFCNRILGFVNANALMQRVVARLQNVRANVSVYQARRDRLCDALARMGFSFVRPSGAFYVFPRSPFPDDVKFSALLRKYGVIVVPGTGFHRPGHFRISFAVNDAVIDRSLEFFEKAAQEAAVLSLAPEGRQ